MGQILPWEPTFWRAEQIWPLRWSQKQRLEFIEFRLQWEGRVNRSDLINFFAISVPQASLDFAKYRELAPDNAVYDATEKTYIAGSSFAPVLVSNSADDVSQPRFWRPSPETLGRIRRSWDGGRRLGSCRRRAEPSTLLSCESCSRPSGNAAPLKSIISR